MEWGSVVEEPVFSLGRVQYVLPSDLESLACTSNILCLCVAPQGSRSGPKLIRINLNRPEEEEFIDIPYVQAPASTRSSTPSSLSTPRHKVFCDPTGSHILVASDYGETFYYCGNWTRDGTQTRMAKTLSKLRGVRVTSVAWNWTASLSTTNQHIREILLGTADGRILEVVLDADLEPFRPFSRNQHERQVRQLLALPDPQPVTGLWYEIWSNVSHGRRRVVILASNNTCLYQFVSETGRQSSDDSTQTFEIMTNVYRDTMPKTLELPGEIPSSELRFWRPLKEKSNDAATIDRPRRIAWLTGPGIYHGNILYSSQEPGDGVIDAAQLVPYPARQSSSSPSDKNVELEVPMSIALSQHHLILLYSDRVRAIRTLDDVIVYEEFIDLAPDEMVKGLVADETRKTYWCYSNKSIFEISVVEEDRDLWRVYLERHAFETALEVAKTPSQRDLILGKLGDHLYKQDRYVQAAEMYAQSTRNFEEIVLKFTDANDQDALRNYLSFKLGRLHKSEKSQRLMLSMWLIEMFLAKINQLEDETASEINPEQTDNLEAEKTVIEDDLKQFLRAQKDNLNSDAVIELMTGHGRTELLLFYCSISGHINKVVAHWVECSEWQNALSILNQEDNMELFYQYAPVLMREIPQATVDTMIRLPLDPQRVMPCLVPPQQTSPTVTSQIARYLLFQIFNCNNRYPPLHNALINIYASSPIADETELVKFLSTSSEDPISSTPIYDLDYALRVCKENNRLRASVHIYARMGLYESSIDLALKSGDVDLAITFADKPEDNKLLRRKLWLKIAQHIIRERQDVKTAVEFLEKTDLLQIEDILPFFPNFVVIDDFKEEICKALEACSSNIENLKSEMDGSEQNARMIKKDIEQLQSRFAVIDANQRCEVCNLAVLTRQFYIFPCQHAFHGDCLINLVTKNLPRYELRKIVELQNQIALQTGNQNKAKSTSGKKLALAAGEGLNELRKLVLPDTLMDFVGGGFIGGSSTPLKSKADADIPNGPTQKHLTNIEKLKHDLDELVASSCALCDGLITSIDKPFVLDGEEQRM